MNKLFAAVLASVAVVVSAHAADDGAGMSPVNSISTLAARPVGELDAIGESMSRSFTAMLSDPAQGKLELQRTATRRYLEEMVRGSMGGATAGRGSLGGAV